MSALDGAFTEMLLKEPVTDVCPTARPAEHKTRAMSVRMSSTLVHQEYASAVVLIPTTTASSVWMIVSVRFAKLVCTSKRTRTVQLFATLARHPVSSRWRKRENALTVPPTVTFAKMPITAQSA
jgi:hypothetical protein